MNGFQGRVFIFLYKAFIFNTVTTTEHGYQPDVYDKVIMTPADFSIIIIITTTSK